MASLREELKRNTVEITLVKRDKGLGFNIRGGIDVPYLNGDSGIFIAKVREQGAAAEDGRIKEGDKIVAINGVSVERVTHDEAVSLFMKDTKTFKLKMILGAEAIIRRAMREKLERRKNGDEGGIGVGTVLFTLTALAAIGAAGFYAWKRYGQQ